MIFGKTKLERYEKSETSRIAKDGKWFAWFPVSLTDGRTAFMCYVYRRSLWCPTLLTSYNYYDLKDVESGAVQTSQYRE